MAGGSLAGYPWGEIVSKSDTVGEGASIAFSAVSIGTM
jgi:hypothetical protein